MTYSDRILHEEAGSGKEFVHGLCVHKRGDRVEFVAEKKDRKASIPADLLGEAFHWLDLPASVRTIPISDAMSVWVHHLRALYTSRQNTRK